jgi:hypothetical protein
MFADAHSSRNTESTIDVGKTSRSAETRLGYPAQALEHYPKPNVTYFAHQCSENVFWKNTLLLPGFRVAVGFGFSPCRYQGTNSFVPERRYGKSGFSRWPLQGPKAFLLFAVYGTAKKPCPDTCSG